MVNFPEEICFPDPGLVSKEAMHLAEFPHPGHTEYLTQKMGSKESLMFMVNDDLRIGVATNHIALKEVAPTLSKELVVQKIRLMNNCLKMDFGIERPTIAVLGLTPHVSDNGVFGKEEEELIRPAVVECKKKGIMVMGPFRFKVHIRYYNLLQYTTNYYNIPKYIKIY